MDSSHLDQVSGDAERQASENIAHSISKSSHTADAGPITPVARTNASPIATPNLHTPSTSGLASRNGSTHRSKGGETTSGANGVAYVGPVRDRYFRSRRIKKGEVERPWLKKRDPREKWVNIIPMMGIVCGLIMCGFLIWDGVRSVTNHKYCSVLDENFSSGSLDSNVWEKEIEVGGFGNGQFEQTTDSDDNVFVKDGILHIKPTLQSPSMIDSNITIDLREKGCTSPEWSDCITSTNTTNGTIVQPVKSARINTRLGASIKFGRVEVNAKLPAGDWLWPAIWMLPTNKTYGEWPRSGEIDIAESRGNNHTYAQGGNNVVSSALHFGPDMVNDGWWRNNVKRHALHTTYASGFHTFGVEWTPKYIFTYIDTRLLQVMYSHFDEPFWTYGRFPLADGNGTRIENPWGAADSKAAPFDQDFYLILNVAVGGTNGWFKDGVSGKPWIDASATAKRDFWNARRQWYPTWQDSGWMEVKSVKMLQQTGFKGCNA